MPRVAVVVDVAAAVAAAAPIAKLTGPAAARIEVYVPKAGTRLC